MVPGAAPVWSCAHTSQDGALQQNKQERELIRQVQLSGSLFELVV